MADEHVKHKHNKNDIIIKDQDGTYKILRDGQFVPLDQVEAEEHLKEHEKEDKEKKGMNAEALMKAASQPPKSSHEIKGIANEDLQKKAQAMIQSSGVTFASGEAKNRVITALVAHIKGVRKPFETKEQLMKSPADGGAGLDEGDAQKILQSAGAKMPAASPQKKAPVVKKEQPVPAMSPKMPVGADISKPNAPLKEMPEKEKMEVKQAPVAVPRPQIVDVQQPKVPTVGLAGELSYSLADWRRVGGDPKDRIKKIENQLGVLEEESYPKRLQGLAAWRNSEVMKLYLEAGKKSLESGTPLSQVVGQGGADQLTIDEWEAISELNSRIRA